MGPVLQPLIHPFTVLGLSSPSFLHKEFHFFVNGPQSPLFPGVCLDLNPFDTDNPYQSLNSRWNSKSHLLPSGEGRGSDGYPAACWAVGRFVSPGVKPDAYVSGRQPGESQLERDCEGGAV